ncbi:MAG: hypothetical protein KJ568_00210 [Actinobacteria bacterium]|nr:hypothetical protein [Actinomycetota bacterium]
MPLGLYRSGLYASAASSILTEKTGGVTLSRMPTDKDVKERIKSFSSIGKSVKN